MRFVGRPWAKPQQREGGGQQGAEGVRALIGLLTTAAVVTGLRVALELAAQSQADDPPGDALGRALHYLRDGANL